MGASAVGHVVYSSLHSQYATLLLLATPFVSLSIRKYTTATPSFVSLQSTREPLMLRTR